MKDITIRPIGLVRNSVTEAVDEGWGQVTSTVELREDLHGIVTGIDGFSHAIILTYLHETPVVDDLQRRPRGRADMPMVGLLAQRARHRPNPIGITAVEIIEVHHDRLVVRGLDAIDGTPVVDIKPYVPIFDERDGARVPQWFDRLMVDYF